MGMPHRLKCTQRPFSTLPAPSPLYAIHLNIMIFTGIRRNSITFTDRTRNGQHTLAKRTHNTAGQSRINLEQFASRGYPHTELRNTPAASELKPNYRLDERGSGSSQHLGSAINYCLLKASSHNSDAQSPNAQSAGITGDIIAHAPLLLNPKSRDHSLHHKRPSRLGDGDYSLYPQTPHSPGGGDHSLYRGGDSDVG